MSETITFECARSQAGEWERQPFFRWADEVVAILTEGAPLRPVPPVFAPVEAHFGEVRALNPALAWGEPL